MDSLYRLIHYTYSIEQYLKNQKGSIAREWSTFFFLLHIFLLSGELAIKEYSYARLPSLFDLKKAFDILIQLFPSYWITTYVRYVIFK